jgi:hypothetical protein
LLVHGAHKTTAIKTVVVGDHRDGKERLKIPWR